jgi:peptidoglycan/LPS O-acetylase OafA/YrhL
MVALSVSHKNNFGLLRLIFALLVVVSHSFEIMGRPDALVLFFGTISSGKLAVDGFFLVSGFLVAQSFDHSRTVTIYLLNRILRIYPGFIIASLICLFLVGPLSGADMSPLYGFGGALKTIYHAWPVQILLIWYFPAISPWVALGITTACACVFGLISWLCVEKPFLALKPGRGNRHPKTQSAAVQRISS